MKTPLAQLVRHLYLSRVAAKEAKNAWHFHAEKGGSCQNQDQNGAKCHHLDPSFPRCPACTYKLPHWTAYRQATNKAGAALRAVLRAGKEMDE
jgi:hypothetical protein